MTYARLLAASLLVGGELLAADFNVEQFTADAKAALVQGYKDPGSAQFRDTFVMRFGEAGRETYALCGEVNAKNSYGAYVGFVPFYVNRTPGGQWFPSSATDGNDPAMKDVNARFAIAHCTGERRPVTRIN